MKPFVDLLHRDEYSLKCALGNTKKILPLLKERNQTHYAVSNYNEISNWVQQLFTCKDNGIVPMLGMEVYVNDWRLVNETPEDMVFKNLVTGKDVSINEMDESQRDMTTLDWPLTIYANTIEGYHNVISIHNDAQLNGVWKRRPRTSSMYLKTHGKGVIAILRPLYSDVGSYIYNGKDDLALERLEFYQSIFDDVYLSVMISTDRSYQEVNDGVIQFAEKNHLKVIPILNSHYINPEDEKAWRVLRRLSTLTASLSSYEIERLFDNSYYSREKVDSVFNKYCKSSVFTETVYENCQKELDSLLGRFTTLDIDCTPKLPKFKDGEKKLREAAEKGFVERGYDKKGKEYRDRLEYELDNIIGCKFVDYFLIIKEVFDWYKKDVSDVVAVGRGSAAGSLVLNCLGCTDVDPIANQLLFERFLDASRLRSIVESGGKITGDMLPDVDSDWATPMHDAVKHHFVDVYGEKCTASIGNIGFMKTKSTLKDLARLYEIPPDEINEVTKQINAAWADDPENDVTIEKLRKTYPDLDRLLNKYPEMGHVFEDLRGTPSNWGVHAGGVLITDFDLTDQVPLRRSDDGKLVTCWTEGINARELGMMGLIKFDMLAIDQINIIDDTLKLIKEHTGKEIKVKDIPLGDYKALSQMNRHDGICVFQFETDLAGRVTDNMSGIRQFEDLASLSTLMRPAALSNGFDKEFGLRRDGKSDGYVPDCLKKYVETTYGLPIYQEHIMQIFMELAGFDKVTAYSGMKKIYKNKLHTQEEKDELRKKFVKGCQPKVDSGEIPPDYPDKCFDQILAFLGYGFCKCVWEWCTVEVLDKDGYSTVVPIRDLKVGDKILAPDEKGNNIYVEVKNIWRRKKEVWSVTFFDFSCVTSLEHRYLCDDGKKHPLLEILKSDLNVFTKKGFQKILSISRMGVKKVVDIEVDHPLHCFYANGVTVSNSHALSYSVYSAIDLWLKAYYPLEFMCVNLSITRNNAEKKGNPLLEQRVRYCRSRGIKIFAPDVRYSADKWIIHEGGLMAPLTNMKGFGINDYDAVVKNRPYKSVTDFMDKTKLGSSKFDILCLGGALDCFGGREYLYNWYHEYYEKNRGKKKNSRQLSFLDALDEGFEIKTQLPQVELDECFREYNGFSMVENLLVKYADLFKKTPSLRELGDVLKNRKNKHSLVLCKVLNITSFKSRNGTDYKGIEIGDGVDNAETVMKAGDWRAYERTLKQGNVLMLPIQLDDKDGFYIDDLDRYDVKVIERAK